MTCDQFQQYLPDHLTGSLRESEKAEFHEHLDGCALCREEAERAGRMWELLGVLEPEAPTPRLRSRFYDSLAAYQQGMSQPRASGAGLMGQMRAWWSRQPVFQVAYSLFLLAAGALGGHALSVRQANPPELAQMQQELAGMRQMVTLSLLQQQSASERLRGVDWSQQVDRSDTQVLGALLSAVNHDPNVNVRLAAVDALRRFTGNTQLRRRIDDSLARQNSPLTQIALIDLIVDLREKHSVPALRSLAQNASVSPEVRERASWGITQLQ
ncbi:MAG TPA: zf-HC2 domain-containing protein [Polyangiaceae bacterium]|nr:zf-HC2 domain-containing protein [Polyangiaceae bacterium]